jgi:gas vesicle protein
MRYDEENFWPAKISEKTVSVNSLVWLLLGMGIGAGAALLLTPANGREVRSALAHGYRRTLDGVSRGTRQLRQHGSNLISFSRRSS